MDGSSAAVWPRTERMVLRGLRPSDAGLIQLYAGDLRVARMTTSIPHPNPPGAVQAFIAATLDGRRGEDVWVMDGTPEGGAELIGLISARARVPGEYDLGYWVGPPFWNTGYASEAVQALVAHLLDSGASLLRATVFQDNPVSARVVTKAGFAYQGAGEAHSVARGAMVPVWHYALTREGAGDEVS